MGARRNFRIGYWLGHASARHGGVGTYALRTLRALLAAGASEWRFVLLCRADARDEIDDIVARSRQEVEIQLLPSAPSVETNQADYASQHDLRLWLDGLSLDLVHFPMPTPPHPEGHVPYHAPPLLRLRAPYIVTVHDVQELRFPEYFSTAQRAVRAAHHWESLDQARKVIVSYRHVKDDLIKYFRLPDEKIHVCPIPFREISLPEPTTAARRVYEQRYGALSPFLLYPAQTWPHKNHARLLEALRRIRSRSGLDVRLICTGQAGEQQEEITARVEALGLRGIVRFAGLVPGDELAWLYRHAALVTVPTEYEAGSFPLMEAMCEGAPVVCSNVTSLPETIGDSRFVFDPYDVETTANLILRMLTDAPLRGENVANGARQAARLRGVDAAPFFHAAYRDALAGV